jgi:hypothetical protein
MNKKYGNIATFFAYVTASTKGGRGGGRDKLSSKWGNEQKKVEKYWNKQ